MRVARQWTVIAPNGLNARAEPSLSSQILAKLKKDQEIVQLARQVSADAVAFARIHV